MIASVIEGTELRAVMGRVPAAVAVVTVALRGQRVGLTVGSLVSLSLEPPLIGLAVRRDAALHELLRDAGRFSVTVLAHGQETLAQHFARGVPPIALWEGVAIRPAPDPDTPPELDGAVAWLRCRLRAQHEAGDHTFFVGEVESAEAGPAERPLVFHRRAYAAL
jgi:flavin reductase (DIM6/NTAB) family NADH-FMN oxidoreductase RutF